MTIHLDTETIPTQNPTIQAHIAAECAAENLAWAKGLVKAPDADRMRERGTEKLDDAYRKTSLQPALGELYCVSYARNMDEPLLITRGDDWKDPASEVRLLQDTADVIADVFREKHAKERRFIVGANIVRFDRSMLRGRSIIRKVRMPEVVYDTRPEWDRESPWRCILSLFSGGDRWSIPSLDDFMLGLGRHDLCKSGIDGSKVWDAVLAGQGDYVGRYCCDDVRRVQVAWAALVEAGVVG